MSETKKDSKQECCLLICGQSTDNRWKTRGGESSTANAPDRDLDLHIIGLCSALDAGANVAYKGAASLHLCCGRRLHDSMFALLGFAAIPLSYRLCENAEV